MNVDHQPHPRINASLLTNYQGKHVTVIGIASSQSNDGRTFQLTSSDDRQIMVNLAQPAQDSIFGLVEVHGTVNERNNIVCHNYVLFGAEAAKNFDMDAYNKAVELIHKLPEHYPILSSDQPA